ncbi:MAG: lipid-A-disaccharide synthase [Bacteroidales bacterium]|nr:lipid-A-disaccharide synthase [Bacteroidales bacterium]
MKYYIISGEASGDLHGSNLMKGLYAEDPEADVRFWGGPLMDAVYHEHQEGEGLVVDYTEGAVMGFLEVLQMGKKLLERYKMCRKDIMEWKPDVVILIDYPGFNFRIAAFAHRHGFKVFYYIAPKVWASREGRIAKLKANVDKLFIIFPFEVDYFTRKGLPFSYCGNPLMDGILESDAMKEDGASFLSRNGLPEKPYIALLAGSRNGEIATMMPTFMEFAERMRELPAYKEYNFVLAAPPSRKKADYAGWLEGRPWLHVVENQTYSVMRHAQAAVINSGTASLEAAIIGVPQVVGYKTSAVTYLIGRNILKIKYISLANLIIDKPAFKEYLQEYFTSDNLIREVRRILEDERYRQGMMADYDAIRSQLGGVGASRAVAQSMIQEIKGLTL